MAFGRQKKGRQVSEGQIENFIGQNTSIEGTLKTDGNLRVDGIFQGRIETAGNVIIGPSARVIADIVANAVQVWGLVKGNITTIGRLEILPSGRVWGDVQVSALMIDEGGIFRGQCHMEGEPIEPLLLTSATEEEQGIIEGQAQTTAEAQNEHATQEGSDKQNDEE